VCTATSGGHFSPGVTVVHLLFNRLQPAKAIRLAKNLVQSGKFRRAKTLMLLYEDTSLLKFLVALSPACWFIGNGIHLSRSTYLSPLLSQRDFRQRFAHLSTKEAEAALRAAGRYDIMNFSSVGPAGIFAFYANPAAPLGQVFLNEFVSVCRHISLCRLLLKITEPG